MAFDFRVVTKFENSRGQLGGFSMMIVPRTRPPLTRIPGVLKVCGLTSGFSLFVKVDGFTAIGTEGSSHVSGQKHTSGMMKTYSRAHPHAKH